MREKYKRVPLFELHRMRVLGSLLDYRYGAKILSPRSQNVSSVERVSDGGGGVLALSHVASFFSAERLTAEWFRGKNRVYWEKVITPIGKSRKPPFL